MFPECVPRNNKCADDVHVLTKVCVRVKVVVCRSFFILHHRTVVDHWLKRPAAYGVKLARQLLGCVLNNMSRTAAALLQKIGYVRGQQAHTPDWSMALPSAGFPFMAATAAWSGLHALSLCRAQVPVMKLLSLTEALTALVTLHGCFVQLVRLLAGQ